MKSPMRFPGLATALIMFVILGTAGCRSAAPVSFYTLSPIAVPENSGPAGTGRKAVTIGVGPLAFPDYLNRVQIVTRSGPGRVSFSEFNRWAGFLDKEFLKTVAENLSVLLSNPQVMVYPWNSEGDPDYRIDFDVKQFEGNPGESVRLNVIWTLRFNKDGAPSRTIRRSVFVEPVSGDGYEALVAAHSRVVEALSHEIAAVIGNPEAAKAGEPVLKP